LHKARHLMGLLFKQYSEVWWRSNHEPCANSSTPRCPLSGNSPGNKKANVAAAQAILQRSGSPNMSPVKGTATHPNKKQKRKSKCGCRPSDTQRVGCVPSMSPVKGTATHPNKKQP
jgi:hypothetical protein